VLARGAQDLADLGDERLDVVTDAALAELAETGEVTADLSRVDVCVLRKFLGGDRFAPHLARLRQHLQVTRKPAGPPGGEPTAADKNRLRRFRLFDRRAHGPTVSSLARTAASSRISSETISPSTSTTGIFSSISRSNASSLSISTS